MTTIIYREGTVLADRQSTNIGNGNLIERCKIYVPPSPVQFRQQQLNCIAAAGSRYMADLLIHALVVKPENEGMQWLNKVVSADILGADVTQCTALICCSDILYKCAIKGASMTFTEHSYHEPLVIGTGAPYVLPVMRLGDDLVEWFTAAQQDPHTGAVADLYDSRQQKWSKVEVMKA